MNEKELKEYKKLKKEQKECDQELQEYFKSKINRENKIISEKDIKIPLWNILESCNNLFDNIFEVELLVLGKLTLTKMILKPEQPAEHQCKEIFIENPKGISFKEFIKAIEKLSYENHIYLEDIKKIGKTDDGIPIYNIHFGS